MRCPKCNSINVIVLSTNPHFKFYTHRWKGCKDCGAAFQTGEEIIKDTIKEDVYNMKLIDKYKIALTGHDKMAEDTKTSGKK